MINKNLKFDEFKMCLNIGVENLMKRLGTRNNLKMRQESIQDLVIIGELALDQLIDALQHNDRQIRRGLAEVLGIIGSKSAEGSLIEVFKMEKDKYVQFQIKYSLRKIRERK